MGPPGESSTPKPANTAAVAELAGFALSCFVEFAHDNLPLAPLIVFEIEAGVRPLRFDDTPDGMKAATDWIRRNPEAAARAVLCVRGAARGSDAFVATCWDLDAVAAFRIALRYRPPSAASGFAIDSAIEFTRDHVGSLELDYRQVVLHEIPKGSLGRRRGFDLWERHRRTDFDSQ